MKLSVGVRMALNTRSQEQEVQQGAVAGVAEHDAEKEKVKNGGGGQEACRVRRTLYTSSLRLRKGKARACACLWKTAARVCRVSLLMRDDNS